MTLTALIRRQPVIDGITAALPLPEPVNERQRVAIEDFLTWTRWAQDWERRTAGHPLSVMALTVISTGLTAAIGQIVADRSGHVVAGAAAAVGVAGCLALVRVWPVLAYWGPGSQRAVLFRARLEDRVFNPLRGAFEAAASELRHNNDRDEVAQIVAALDSLQETHRILALRLLLTRMIFVDRRRSNGIWTITMAFLLLWAGTVAAWAIAQPRGEASILLSLWGEEAMSLAVFAGIGLATSVAAALTAQRGTLSVRNNLERTMDAVLAMAPPPLRDEYAREIREWSCFMAHELTVWMDGARMRGIAGRHPPEAA